MPPRAPSSRPARLHPSLFLICLTAALCLLRPAFAAGEGAYERWYVLRMQDQRAGWMHDRRTVDDQRIVSQSTIHIEMKRGTQVVAVTLDAEFIETPAGEAISMKSVSKLGSTPSTEEFVFTKDGIDVTSFAGDGPKRTTRRARPEGQWLAPAAGARFLKQRLQAGAKEISLRVIDPFSGVDPILYNNSVVEQTTIEALGKTVPAVKWRVTTDRHPGMAITEYVDEFGAPIRSDTTLGGMRVETILADRDIALSRLDAPELLVSTLVRPDRRIKNPRAVTSATYVLSVKDGPFPPIPSGGTQTVTPDGGSRMIVAVDSSSVSADHDQPTPQQQRASAMVTSDDPRVKELAAKAAAKAGPDKSARAEAHRRFVHDYIDSKNLGVGFASAAEVARTRTGDCTEHAVLLAAMLRADGFHSRVVSGLIYADEFEGQRHVFGYHMWTQAFIDNRWVNLDATFPAGAAFDATHIALGISDLADADTSNTLVSLVPLLGNLSITVRSTSTD